MKSKVLRSPERCEELENCLESEDNSAAALVMWHWRLSPLVGVKAKPQEGSCCMVVRVPLVELLGND